MKNEVLAAALLLSGLAGCAQPTSRESGPLLPPAITIVDTKPSTLTHALKNPLRISWKSDSIFRKKKPYLYDTDRSAPESYLAEGLFQYFDSGNIKLSYQATKNGFIYREIKKREASRRRQDCLEILQPEACVEDHTLFVALEVVCEKLPCAGKLRLYDAYQPILSVEIERYISQVWRNFFLGKALPSAVSMKHEYRLSVTEGSALGDYLTNKVRFVFEGVEKIKRENPRMQYR